MASEVNEAVIISSLIKVPERIRFQLSCVTHSKLITISILVSPSLRSGMEAIEAIKAVTILASKQADFGHVNLLQN